MDALKIEGLYKEYRLGEVGTGTFAHDLNRFWYRLRGKKNPYEKIIEANDRTKKTEGQYVWALEDINFSVSQGEVLGVIGRNGAGKSTLLKILSKVTSPTRGSIAIHGRIASLLEVGTGFHPELTGRENIFLNGAILGMTKNEIRSKFDEIVAFSGVEKYIDTPVKRYSSGMYVRLAFAVAAHLEPEILIIDEVLAVGDAEFQRKCLGKMKEVAGEGRTVLFVSHNMTAVKKLCSKGLLLDQGRVVFMGSAEETLQAYYVQNAEFNKTFQVFEDSASAPGAMGVYLKKIALSPSDPFIDDHITVDFEFFNSENRQKIAIAFDLLNQDELIVFGSGVTLKSHDSIFQATCYFPKNLLNEGNYSIHLYVNTDGYQPLFSLPEAIRFEITERERAHGFLGKINGVVRPELTWKTA